MEKITIETKIELITKWIIKKIDNGELSDEFYQWKQLDYNNDSQYEMAQKIQEKLQYYDKLAFEVECGNDLMVVLDEGEIDSLFESLEHKR